MKCTVKQKDRIVSERFFSACDFVILSPADEFLSSPGNTLIAFCKTDYIMGFFNLCRQNIDTKYVLITHNSDYPITQEIFFQKPRNIIKWYGQNIDYFHPILESIPIGSHISTWIGTKEDADIVHHPDFVVMPETSEPKKHKNLAYMDFGIWTNASHRRKVYNFFKDKGWVTHRQCDIKPDEYKKSEHSISIQEQCQDIYDHKFVISPLGNGVDCGRNWLALYLGSFPVIPWHKNIEFYRDLPFVVYKDLEEVTEDFLNEKYDEIMSKEYNLDKAKVSYWINKFKIED
jgi:hypothetical protein